MKSRRGGYDGRGQVVVPPGGEISGSDAIVEDRVEFDRELSIVAGARSGRTGRRVSARGEPARRGHPARHHRAGADTSAALQAVADQYVTRLAESLDYVGVLALELFQVGDALLANEMAPWVHNTGHWTIEGAATSQFTQHLLDDHGSIAGPGCGRLRRVMTNLIGELPDPLPAGHLHLYGKAPRPGRKLGHVDAARLGGELFQALREGVPGQRGALDAHGELHDAAQRLEVAELHVGVDGLGRLAVLAVERCSRGSTSSP